jgi:uncharacterized protein (TIGR00266 family)
VDVQIRQNPSFSIGRLNLGPNEPVRVEAGAMMAMSGGVMLQAKAEGGIMKSLKRAALGGESFFVSTYTAPAQGGFVDVAARLPGDMGTYEVAPGRALFISKGSWLANETTVNLDTKWGGFKNMFGSEGGFIARAEGQGKVVFGAYGAVEMWTLEPGQGITVDTGHMVAYEESVQFQLRKASETGLMQSFKAGEGLVFDFRGPGRVWTQSRNPQELIGWIQGFIGGGTTAGGPLGLFGRE